MTDKITNDQKEFDRAWSENEDIQTFLEQNDIDAESESMYFCAAWFMWKMAKGIK